MSKFDHIVVSPSGYFYGSENVLLDFLLGSQLNYKIYAPKNSLFYIKLRQLGYDVNGFSNLKLLYFRVFITMLFSKSSLYLNEAGHISYINFIARILKKRNFVVSVRLLEDCNQKLLKAPKNIHFVSVSNFLKEKIEVFTKVNMVYDPYRLVFPYRTRNNYSKPLNLAIVGRIAKSKGLDKLFQVLEKLTIPELKNLKILFFGSYTETSEWFIKFKKALNGIQCLNYRFCGFITEQSDIYSNCDMLIHLNENEPLGRVLFEAIDFDKPFMCLNSGGTGELCSRIGLSECAFGNIDELAKQLKSVIIDPSSFNPNFTQARKIIASDFKITDYAMNIEKFLRQ